MSLYGKKSEARLLTACPKCKSTDIKGPFDSALSATFLFTRTYFCRPCWWDSEVRMEDDAAKAAAKAAKDAAKKAATDKRLRRTA